MITKENLAIYTQANILKEYDLSANAREQHDIEAEFNKDGVRIKASREDILQYWKEILTKPKECKEIRIE